MNSIDSLKNSLNTGTLFKPILGAATQNTLWAEQFSYLWSSAGALLIDVRCDEQVIRAAKRGIERSGKSTFIIASVSPLEHDAHFLKALVHEQKCTGCGLCKNFCPHKTIQIDDGKASVNSNDCRGCGHCVEACPLSAIELFAPNDTKDYRDRVKNAINAGADTIELHVSGMCAPDIKNVLVELSEEIRGISRNNIPFSICVGSLKNSPADLLNITEMLVQEFDPNDFLIQLDGQTMSHGFGKDGLLSLALIGLIKSCFPQIHTLASGGTTEKTWKLAKQLSIPISGVGMGIRSWEIFQQNSSDTSLKTANKLFCPFPSMKPETATNGFAGSALTSLKTFS